MSQLVLYDLPTKGPRRACWSLNPWKTRFALNYKRIEYKTEWVEYPDVEDLWKSFGIGPNDPKDYHIAYTSPMVRFPDGKYVMDSQPIAERLEELYPEPSLHLNWKKLPTVLAHATNIVSTTRPMWMPLVPTILSDRGAEYFYKTRKEWYGMTLQHMLETQGAEKGRWERIKPDGKALGDLLRETGGPFFLGDTPSYADFVVAGVIHCMKRVTEEAYTNVLSLDPALEPLYKACWKYLERDDY